MNSQTVVVGIDPSSRKVAVVATVGEHPEFDVYTKTLPPKMPAETCLLAYVWLRRICRGYVLKGYDVQCFVEAPLSAGAKGGVRALIPQAQVSGALLAAARSVRGVDIELVSVGAWKKQVVGKGNAGKADVKKWASECWRNLYKEYSADQDVLDAAAINRWGTRLVSKQPERKRLNGHR